MKRIPYSIVCEDIAHYCYVKRLFTFFFQDIEFELNEACYRQFKCATKKDVLFGYVNIANQAFRIYSIELLVVITDHDDDKRSSEIYHEYLKDNLFSQVRERVIISIPMQAIEHWLRYLQFIRDNPQSTKNVSFESERRSDSKIAVYGSKKPSSDKVQNVVENLLQSEYLPRLISLSASFNRLYQAIIGLV